jgi:hypothetical protein
MREKSAACVAFTPLATAASQVKLMSRNQRAICKAYYGRAKSQPRTTPTKVMSHQSVYAIAISEGQALQIEDRLTQAGFSNNDISALIPDTDSNPEFDTKRPGDALAGTGSGGVLGGALDMLASIGALAIPGVGRLIAAGPLLVALNGIAAGAAVFGIAGALVGLGIPETAAKSYEGRIAEGNILISVHTETEEEVQIAKEVLESAMAEDIAVTAISDEQALG